LQKNNLGHTKYTTTHYIVELSSQHYSSTVVGDN
jgi:hypothetical protein